MNGLPPCTFCLFTYNQEHLIRQSIEAAIAQDYPHLTILVSDDSSTDNTFQVAQKTIQAHPDSPHKIILRKTPKNLGIGAHVNDLLQLAQTDWIIFAAGDDISLPQRTKTLMQYAQQHPGTYGLSSDYTNIDSNGAPIPCDPAHQKLMRQISPRSSSTFAQALTEYLEKRHMTILGCSAAWHKDLYRLFPPFPSNLVYEDVVLTFRARLLGTIKHIEEPLLLYRIHAANTSSARLKNKKVNHSLFYSRRICALETIKSDITHISKSDPSKQQPLALFRRIDKQISEFHSVVLWFQLSPLQKIPFLLGLKKQTPPFVALARFYSRRILPHSIFIQMKTLLSKRPSATS